MAPLIDLALHIELPLGVSLARRLLRDFVPERGAIGDAGADRLRRYLELYLRGGGTAYAIVNEMARETSDVVLDGLADRAALLDQARAELLRRTARAD